MSFSIEVEEFITVRYKYRQVSDYEVDEAN